MTAVRNRFAEVAGDGRHELFKTDGGDGGRGAVANAFARSAAWRPACSTKCASVRGTGRSVSASP
jgi:hypothetical protein